MGERGLNDDLKERRDCVAEKRRPPRKPRRLPSSPMSSLGFSSTVSASSGVNEYWADAGVDGVAMTDEASQKVGDHALLGDRAGVDAHESEGADRLIKAGKVATGSDSEVVACKAAPSPPMLWSWPTIA
jgi:hypothetical protein